MVITVAAVDSHPIVLRGLTALLAEHRARLRLVATARTVLEHLAGPGRGADVVLLELPAPGAESTEDAVAQLTASGSRVLLHTAQGRPVPLRRGVRAGAVGVILKDDGDDAVVATITAAATGDLACSSELARALLTDPALVTRLAPQQVAVLRLAARGLSYDGIGRELSITRHTVRTHLSRASTAYATSGHPVHNTHALVHAALADGYLDPPPPR